MKLGLFQAKDVRSLAAVYDDVWVSVPEALKLLGEEPVSTIEAFIEQYGDSAAALDQKIRALLDTGAAEAFTYPMAETTFLAPLPTVPKLFTARGNSAVFTRVIRSAICTQPIMEQRYNFNLVGHLSTEIVRPGFVETGWNYEMVAVIGKSCRNVSSADVDDYVFGYTNMLDHSGGYESPFAAGGIWDVPADQKVFADGAYGYCYNGNTQVPTPIGPYITTKDEVGDPHDQLLEERESGRLVSLGSGKAVAFTIQEMISYVSGFMTLQPGDMLSTASITYDGYPSPKGKYPPNAYIEARTQKLGSLKLWIKDEREDMV